jgi:hypothetical protein
MAQIVDPAEISQPSLGMGGLVSPRSARRPVDAASEAFGELTDFYLELEDTQRKFRRKVLGGRTKALYTEELINKRMEMQDDDDPATRVERFTEFAENLRQGMSDQIEDTAVRELFDIEASDLMNAQRLTVFQGARRQEIDTHKNDLLDTLRIFSNAADTADAEGNLLSRDFAIEDGLNAIDDAPFLDDLEKGNLRRGYLEELDTRRVLRLTRAAVSEDDFTMDDLQGGLEAAATALDQAENLSPLQRERLEARIDSTMRTGLNDLEMRSRRQEAADERAQKDREESIAIDLYHRVGLPPDDPAALKAEELEQRRHELSFTDYRTLRQAMRNAELGEDDSTVVISTRNLISDPNFTYTQKRELINEAYRRNVEGLPGITRQTWSQMQSINESMNKPEIPTPYRRWSQALSGVFQSTPWDAPGSRADLEARQGNSLAEFDRFALANPDASESELKAMAGEIARAYAPDFDFGAPFGEKTMAKPFGYTGPREEVSMETLKAAAKRLTRGRENGVVTEPQYEFHSRKLSAWEAYLGRKAAIEALATGAPQAGAQ